MLFLRATRNLRKWVRKSGHCENHEIRPRLIIGGGRFWRRTELDAEDDFEKTGSPGSISRRERDSAEAEMNESLSVLALCSYAAETAQRRLIWRFSLGGAALRCRGKMAAREKRIQERSSMETGCKARRGAVVVAGQNAW